MVINGIHVISYTPFTRQGRSGGQTVGSSASQLTSSVDIRIVALSVSQSVIQCAALTVAAFGPSSCLGPTKTRRRKRKRTRAFGPAADGRTDGRTNKRPSRRASLQVCEQANKSSRIVHLLPRPACSMNICGWPGAKRAGSDSGSGGGGIGACWMSGPKRHRRRDATTSPSKARLGCRHLRAVFFSFAASWDNILLFSRPLAST